MSTYLRTSLIILIALTVLFFFKSPAILETADNFISDQFTKLNQKPLTPKDIVIIDITDTSLNLIGDWPWPRDTLAQILSQIQQKQSAKIIGLDILFPERKVQEQDLVLAKLVQNEPLCISQAFDLETNPSPRKIGTLTAPQETGPKANKVIATGYVGNYSALAQATNCAGHITPLADVDGLIRKIPRAIQYQENQHLSLAESMLIFSQTDYQPIPTDKKGVIRIPFEINPNHFEMIPIEELLFGQIADNALKNKFVLIGSSALGLSDRVPTPVHPWLPGVVIHAEMLYSMIHQSYQPWENMQILTLMFTFVSLIIMVITLIKNKPILNYVLFLTLSTTWLIISYQSWQAHSQFSLSLPFIALTLTIITLQPLQWRISQVKKRQITGLFKSYLSAELVDQLIKTPNNALKPQKKEITILFADIAGFTNMAKSLPSEQLAKITRDVLTVLTKAIQLNNGTLDKYIGDEVMAFWNAPFDQQNHAQLAFETAQKMIIDLQEYNNQHPEQPEIKIRIGIDTGVVLVGDLGTDFRHSYTVIGEAVNSANALYDIGKIRDKEIMISENTFSQLTDHKNLQFTAVNYPDSDES